MIERVLIVPYSRHKGTEIEKLTQDLWPAKRNALKIFSDFLISHYIFKVTSKQKSYNFKIVINGFEIIDLEFVEEKKGVYHYQSDKLRANSFLGFNLGLLELYISNEDEKQPLTTLNNKQGLLPNKSIGYIYESVASSDFFSFYVSNYFRANAPSKRIDTDEINKHFWLKIAIANELLKEVQRFFIGELEFTSRVHNTSEVKKYNKRAVIEDRDIHWLMENPNEMFISEFGDIPYLGMKYDIEFISQSIMCTDYDTYENRLLVSCMYSVKSTLEELSEEYHGNKFFPHKSINNIVDITNDLLSKVNSTLNLLPPFNTRPEFSNKYLDDVRYVKLFGVISRWYSFNDLAYGSEQHSPILGITEIFEHYCFIKIVESLKETEFVVDSLSLKDLDTAGRVIMRRGVETVSIYYEPIVSVSEFSPLKCSKKQTYYHPDIVLIYENQDYTKCGVIDPKFSTIETVRKKLAPEIFYKYGLFFHRPDGLPIDYVYAMYPDLNEISTPYDFRSEIVSSDVTPLLGCLSIPFHDKSAELMTKFLNTLITQ